MTEVAEQPLKVTAEQLGIRQGDEYEGHLEFDLGNLAAFDYSPLDADALRSSPNDACQELATKITQSLVGRLFSLPTESAAVGKLAHLPAPTTQLPREKPLPKPRAPTRWERFATQKGIQKQKRSKLVWDEDQQEWRRRHGYKRAHDDNDIPVIEAKAGDEPGADPFSKLKADKKARVAAQGKRQAANLKAQAKAGGAGVLPATIKLAAALPEHGKGRPVKRKEMAPDLKTASRQAGISTASMGKFDKRVAGEKEGERNNSGKRRKFLPVTGAQGETTTVSGVVDRILREKSDDIIDVNRAVGRMEADARQERHQAKLAGTADADGKAQKGKGRFGKGRKGGGKPVPAGPKGGKKSGKRAAKDAKRKR